MADSPKCKECADKGVDAQTYKVAGKGFFKCQKCGKAFPKDSFNPPDFNWRNK